MIARSRSGLLILFLLISCIFAFRLLEEPHMELMYKYARDNMSSRKSHPILKPDKITWAKIKKDTLTARILQHQNTNKEFLSSPRQEQQNITLEGTIVVLNDTVVAYENANILIKTIQAFIYGREHV